jgi:choline dehydrogenase-like flavoprotein
MDSTALPSFPRLERDQRVDIVVVGAGIVGLTTAYLMTKAGRSVAVVERDDAVEHDTGHTSAHLSMVTDAWLSELVDRFGRDHAQAAWDAGLAAIAQIDAIVRNEDIACDFAWVPGYLHRSLGAPGETGGFVTTALRRIWMTRSSMMRCRRSGRVRGSASSSSVSRQHAGDSRQAGTFTGGAGVPQRAEVSKGERTHHRVRRHRAGSTTRSWATSWPAQRSSVKLFHIQHVGGRKKGLVPVRCSGTANPYHYLRISPLGFRLDFRRRRSQGGPADIPMPVTWARTVKDGANRHAPLVRAVIERRMGFLI